MAVVAVLVVALVILVATYDASREWTPAEAAAVKYDADDIRYIETRLGTTDSGIAKWWIEILDEAPWRDIGFDAASNALTAAPSQSVDGFWNDTEMTLDEFQDHDPNLREISATDFEAEWERFFDRRDVGPG